MSTMQMLRWMVPALLLFLLCSCRATKYLKEGEELYTGATIRFDSISKKRISRDEHGKLNDVLLPKPNKKILGWRYKLWFYNITGETKKKSGWKYFWKYKVGEPPVLLSNVPLDRNARLLTNRLTNFGYFRSSASYEVVRKKKTASTIYDVYVAEAYTLGSITFPPPDSRINKKIDESQKESLLKIGDHYSLDAMEAERVRIDANLKNEGYFYFNPGYLLFRADTSIGNRQCAITLVIKDNVPEDALKYYRINDVTIYPEYLVTYDTLVKRDTAVVDNIKVVERTNTFRSKVLVSSVYVLPNAIYSSKQNDITIRRLMGLGAFKYGNIKYEKVDTAGGIEGRLNAGIYLTPFQKRALRAELSFSTKLESGYTGPGVSFTYKNRNLFHGCEELSVSLTGNFEAQLTSDTNRYTSYGFGIHPQLIIPRFITPFHIAHASSIFVPKTKISLAYDLSVRQQYYTLHSFGINFGYIWKETITKQHELNPVSVTYINPTHLTAAFDSTIALFPSLKQSFEQQFILGISYAYTFSDQVLAGRNNPVYFRGRLEFSGNMAYLLQALFTQRTGSPENPFRLFDLPYSMYGLTDLDFRIYFKAGKQARLIPRLYFGIGVPYGNSKVMPYYKQFSSGGPSGLRGFRYRAVGPGTFNTALVAENNLLLDQVGDMKLEGNLEYRFPLVGPLKGAIFTDAGNIWNLNPESLGDSTVFHFNSFINELAVDIGFGIRLDLNFFVIRVDFGMPIHVPYLPEGQRWVFNQIQFGDPTWRKNNLIFNFAIGYPF